MALTLICFVLLIATGNCLSLKKHHGPKWPPGGKTGQPTDFYVDQNGDGKGDGRSPNGAFKYIQDCVEQLEIAGDRCLIFPGRYHEEVSIKGKFASVENPFVIQGIGGSHPILDGTTEIKGKFLDKEQKGIWKVLEDGNCRKYPIYYTPYDQKVWQLFIDGEMMTNARWPNAKWSDKSLFDASLWGKSTDKTTQHRLHDKDRKLSKSWIDAMGAIAILNIGSWDTFVSKVLNHTRGQDWFDFDNTWGHLDHLNAKKGQYFLESKMEFLDSEEEWFIDDKYIYVWPTKGKDPTSSKVVGKNSTFAFTISNSSNVLFKNLDFFATSITTIPYTDRVSHIGNIRFENLNFQFPSYSKRILGEAKKPQRMNIDAYARIEEEMGDLEFFNCTWYGSDGVPLTFTGRDVSLRNNLWELNDWSGANNDDGFSGGKGTVMSGRSKRETFHRNTLKNNGASAGYRPNQFSMVRLNEISGQCWGLGQNDGSGIQVMIGAQNAHTNISQNWIHDQPKLGIRFDCPNGGTNWNHLGRGATVQRNVVWNAGGIMVKGDDHKVIGNLAFTPSSCFDEDAKPHLLVPHWIGTNPIPFNNETRVVGNIADISNGGVSRVTKKRIPLSGSVVENNFPDPWNSCDEVCDSLVDAKNRDFRPKIGSAYATANAGPYKAGIGAEVEYWIPGRQTPKASHPIPAHEHIIKGKNRDALMFLQGYNADRHHVYFSSIKGAVDRRSTKHAFLKTLHGSANKCEIPVDKSLEPHKKYFWAVDACVGQEVIKGDIWEFSIDEEE